MTKTLKNLADYALEVYNEKFIYGWATSGQRLRDVYARLKNCDYYKRNPDNFKEIERVYNTGANPQMVDCFGIAEACRMEVGDECPYNNTLDSTSDIDFAYVKSHGVEGVDWGTIDTIDRSIEGLGVTKTNHFGVYMGDGTVIDINQSGYPARRKPLEYVAWQHWYIPRGFERTPVEAPVEAVTGNVNYEIIIVPSTGIFRRTSPDNSANANNVYDRLAMSQAFTCDGITIDGWLHIVTGEWIEACYCRPITEGKLPIVTYTPKTSNPVPVAPVVTANSSFRVKITCNTLRVRKSPSTSSTIVEEVHKGDVFTIVEVINDWGKLKSGVGYIFLTGYTVRV